MIPGFQKCMLPLLKLASDENEHKFSDAVRFLSDQFELTDEERAQMIPSNTQSVMTNRVTWARTYMKKAGLLEDPRRGVFKITKRGKDVLAKNPPEINVKYLAQFDEFKQFRETRNSKEENESVSDVISNATPQELLDEGYAKLTDNLADDVLEKILSCSPNFFERLVIDLLVRMGYGGSFGEAAQVVGKSGDGGIDGIIKEDKLGLDAIYIQAKRWENGIVGRPEIQKFVGALAGQKATKGVFITTSKFSKEAFDYVETVGTKIILIDGQRLASLMIEYNVGVSVAQTYEIKKIDSDYFEE